jgi:hypothetical protein
MGAVLHMHTLQRLAAGVDLCIAFGVLDSPFATLGMIVVDH